MGGDLYRFGLVTSHGGNLSVRDGEAIWITGTGKRLGYLTAQDISRVSLDGSRLSGPEPSSDTAIHLATYGSSGAGAIVHAHAPHAVALTYEAAELVPEDTEGRLHLGSVPVVTVEGDRVAAGVAEVLQERRAAVLRGHGVYTRGDDLWQALHWVMALEESARITYLRRTAGNLAGH